MALPVMIDGVVIEARSHWTSDGSRIVTDATVRTSTGDVVVSQLGGSVDGIGMIQFPGPEILTPGMRVTVAAHSAVDGSAREHIVFDSAKIIAYPPSYVRTGLTKGGKALFWENSCVFVTEDAAGTTAIAGNDEFAVVEASNATWNDDTASCAYLNVMIDGRKAMEVGNDKVNVIKFRDDVWGRPATGDDPARTYSSAAAGLTTVVYVDDQNSDRDGAILDADVELNGVDFQISVNGTSDGPTGKPKQELQNTLTHELGHLRGLEHPCRPSATDPARTDDTGAAVPVCGTPAASTPKITEATMYNYADPGETKKETLSDDDIKAMCDVYPPAKDPGVCEPVGSSGSSGGGGCCSASGGSGASFLLAGLTAALVLRRRTRSKAR